MDDTFTNATADDAPPVTLENLRAIMMVFTDRRLAVPKEIRVHPDYMDVFLANLREEGFVRVSGCHAFMGLPVVADPDVNFGEWKPLYEHTFSVTWEDE